MIEIVFALILELKGTMIEHVAKESLQEIQIDIADFTRSAEANGGIRYLFVAVDIFTKICHAVPIKNKKKQNQLEQWQEY